MAYFNSYFSESWIKLKESPIDKEEKNNGFIRSNFGVQRGIRERKTL